jgi:RNA polymerase primary sigma factor
MPSPMPEPSRSAQIEADLRRQAQHYGRLEAGEEEALLQRRDGDDVDALVKHNLDLVAGQAEAHLDQGLTFADLYQEGSVGLVDAIAAYDGRGDFRDFASLHIGLQMDSLIQSEAAARREAEADLDDVRALDLAQVALRQQLGREAAPAETAKALGWDMERVEKVQANLEYARQENDAATLNFLDDASHDELGVDFLEEPEEDPRRRPSGAGPDE